MANLTLKEIAQKLGLSVSTISKALNDSDEISEATREKVKAFAKEHNYRPNLIAQSLRLNSSKTIGVIIPELTSYFFAKVIEGIESIANERGYQVVIGLSNESYHKEILQLDVFESSKADGVILSLSKETQHSNNLKHLQDIRDANIPIVLFDRVSDEFDCDKVVVDDFHGAKRAVDYLINVGAKEIGLITTEDFISVGNLRTRGFLNALESAGLPILEERILRLDMQNYGDSDDSEMEASIYQFLKKNPKIDGILAATELFGIKAMKCAKMLGKKIPDDIKFISFTNGALSRNADPSLTSIRQFGSLVGENAARKLFERITEKIERKEAEPFETVVVKTEIVERESSSKN